MRIPAQIFSVLVLSLAAQNPQVPVNVSRTNESFFRKLDTLPTPNVYRAASGALVFGAGTVQWSWGLDGNHLDGNSTPDQSIRQATVNLFADMGVQAGSLQSGLVQSAISNDLTRPTSTISSPTGGSVNIGVPAPNFRSSRSGERNPSAWLKLLAPTPSTG